MLCRSSSGLCVVVSSCLRREVEEEEDESNQVDEEDGGDCPGGEPRAAHPPHVSIAHLLVHTHHEREKGRKRDQIRRKSRATPPNTDVVWGTPRRRRRISSRNSLMGLGMPLMLSLILVAMTNQSMIFF